MKEVIKMAVNTLAYATLFMQELDKQLVAGATSGWMEGNAGLVIYNGGNTVKIPKITMDGMGNYNRGTGFVGGSSILTYETKTMGQDRGRTFSLDAMDVNETNFVANASNLMGEFQRTMVIPEIDAYRYSTIAALAVANARVSNGYTPSKADIYSRLKADIATIQDAIGAVPLVITMSIANLAILEGSTEITRRLDVGAFSGTILSEVKKIDECPIIEVPSARLKTAYVFNDGTTAGQTVGGFVPAGVTKNINWIITPANAPIAISKTDNIRIFTPDQNQTADAYKLDYRKYHDLWIMDNQLAGCFVNIKEV